MLAVTLCSLELLFFIFDCGLGIDTQIACALDGSSLIPA